MALSLADSAILMMDSTFRGRVKVAALKYAQYLQLQPSLSNSKSNWIRSTISSPDQTAATLTPAVVMNPNVQGPGADVDDANLSAAVQAVADLQM